MLYRKSLQKRSLNFLFELDNRLELSRRLHDGMAQELAAIGYTLDSVLGDAHLPADLRDRLRESRLKLSAVNANFRDEIYRLRLQSRSEIYEQLVDLLRPIDSKIELDYPDRSPEDEDALGHIFPEIVRNAINHGKALS